MAELGLVQAVADQLPDYWSVVIGADMFPVQLYRTEVVSTSSDSSTVPAETNSTIYNSEISFNNNGVVANPETCTAKIASDCQLLQHEHRI